MRDFNMTSLIAGVVFIVLGVLFLLERLSVLVVSSRYVWPIVLVAVGNGSSAQGYVEADGDVLGQLPARVEISNKMLTLLIPPNARP